MISDEWNYSGWKEKKAPPECFSDKQHDMVQQVKLGRLHHQQKNQNCLFPQRSFWH